MPDGPSQPWQGMTARPGRTNSPSRAQATQAGPIPHSGHPNSVGAGRRSNGCPRHGRRVSHSESRTPRRPIRVAFSGRPFRATRLVSPRPSRAAQSCTRAAAATHPDESARPGPGRRELLPRAFPSPPPLRRNRPRCQRRGDLCRQSRPSPGIITPVQAFMPPYGQTAGAGAGGWGAAIHPGGSPSGSPRPPGRRGQGGHRRRRRRRRAPIRPAAQLADAVT
jgi:hypothetical protein